MEITEVSVATVHHVTVVDDGIPGVEYLRRLAADKWEILVGSSWELLPDCSEEEAAFGAWCGLGLSDKMAEALKVPASDDLLANALAHLWEFIRLELPPLPPDQIGTAVTKLMTRVFVPYLTAMVMMRLSRPFPWGDDFLEFNWPAA